MHLTCIMNHIAFAEYLLCLCMPVCIKLIHVGCISACLSPLFFTACLPSQLHFTSLYYNIASPSIPAGSTRCREKKNRPVQCENCEWGQTIKKGMNEISSILCYACAPEIDRALQAVCVLYAGEGMLLLQFPSSPSFTSATCRSYYNQHTLQTLRPISIPPSPLKNTQAASQKKKIGLFWKIDCY